MEKVTVSVQWCGKNFGATFSDNVPGAVAFTAKDIDELKKEAHDTLSFHTEGLMEDGEDVPQWLRDGNYELVFSYVDVATLLHACEPYVSLAAISRVSGINQGQLSHYANGMKKPREEQRRRIVESLHSIGQQLQHASCL